MFPKQTKIPEATDRLEENKTRAPTHHTVQLPKTESTLLSVEWFVVCYLYRHPTPPA